uniref:transcription termination/antitermination NusG family protein n=1 Tax=uncultured Corynebacterium sp. TaxID=159447 RepID=UPI0025CC488E
MSDENTNSFEAAVQEAVQAQAAEAAAAAEAANAEAERAAAEAEPVLSESATEAVAALGDGAAADAAGETAAAGEVAEAAPAVTEEEDSEYKKRLREFTRELKKLPGQWFIIQCYSGYENKVKTNLDMRAQTLEVEDSIFDVVVPIEQVLEVKDGKKKLVKRKLLPGYVLVRMDLNDAAWSVVRDTPGVTSFVGNEGNATPVK